MTFHKLTRIGSPALSAMVFLLAAGDPTWAAQSAQTQGTLQSRPPAGMKAGETCKRRTDDNAGVVKVDACGRWYCGRVDINDITVLNPRFAEDMGCKWQLKDNHCRCVPK